MVRVLTHGIAEDRRLPIAAKPQGRYGQLIIDAEQKSGRYQLIDITDLPDVFYKHGPAQTGPRPIHLHDNFDDILARTTEGPIKIVTNLANAPWQYEVRYIGHIVVGLNASMAKLQQIPEWTQIGSVGQHAHTFISLLPGVATDLPSGDTIDWIRFPEVQEQVLEAVQIVILAIDI